MDGKDILMRSHMEMRNMLLGVGRGSSSWSVKELEQCSCFSVLWKVEFVGNETGYLVDMNFQKWHIITDIFTGPKQLLSQVQKKQLGSSWLTDNIQNKKEIKTELLNKKESEPNNLENSESPLVAGIYLEENITHVADGQLDKEIGVGVNHDSYQPTQLAYSQSELKGMEIGQKGGCQTAKQGW